MDLTSSQSQASESTVAADDPPASAAQEAIATRPVLRLELPDRRESAQPSCLTHQQTSDLLEHFARTGQSDCFEEIVRRYSAMVLSVCQSVLRNRHDAEDATQTTFFVLAEQVRGGRVIHSLGSWLQQVARRAAVDLRRARSRRKTREQARSASEVLDDSAPAGCERTETAEMVRQELDKIPAKYRIPIVLHYFGGLEFSEVAEQLNIKQPTLGVRLFRGRKMLAERLARRGLALSTPALALWLARVVRQSVTHSLRTAAVRAALTPSAARVSMTAASRVSGAVVGTVVSSKLKLILTIGLFAIAAAAAGAAVGRIPHVPDILKSQRLRLPVPKFISPLKGPVAIDPPKHSDDEPIDNGNRPLPIYPDIARLPHSPVKSQTSNDDRLATAGGAPAGSSTTAHVTQAGGSQVASVMSAHDAPTATTNAATNQYAWASPTWPGRFDQRPGVSTPSASHHAASPGAGGLFSTATDILAMGDTQTLYNSTSPLAPTEPLGAGAVSQASPAAGNTTAATSVGTGLSTSQSTTGVYPVWSQAITISTLTGSQSSAAQWAYLNPANPLVPTAPAGQNFIGAWVVSPGQSELGVSLNDAVLNDFGQGSAGLSIWAYNGEWTQLQGPVNGQLDTPAGTEFIALGTPEPGSTAIIAVVGSVLTLRRGRRRRSGASGI